MVTEEAEMEMENNKTNLIKKVLALVMVVFFIFVPLKTQALAFIPILAVVGLSAIAGYFFAPGLTNTFGEAIIALWDTIVNGVLGGIVVLLANILNFAPSVQNFFLDIDALKVMWAILRDFTNMFFILLLVITAFATIFNYRGYTYRDLLPKIIIAALLINFSLVIFNTAIDVLWLPANMFLKAIGQTEHVGDKIGEIFQVNKIQTSEFAPSVEDEAKALGGKLIFTFFKGLLFLVIIAALGWIGVILLVRIPVLFGLAIVSPIIWLSLIFPKTKTQLWSKWWNQVFYWGIIPALYFAVIYFSLFFNSKIEEEFLNNITFINPEAAFIPIAFNTLILFLINMGLLLGGLYYAHKLASSFGAVGYNFSANIFGVPGGVTKVWTGVKEQGIPRIKIPERVPLIGGWRPVGGAEARERREERIAQALGRIPGITVGVEAQRKFRSQVKDRTEQIEEQLIAGRVSRTDVERMTRASSNTVEGLASRIVSAKRGWLSDDEFTQAIRDVGARNPLAAQAFAQEVGKSRFANLTPDRVLQIASARDAAGNPIPELQRIQLIEARRELYKGIKDSPRIYSSMTQEQFNIAMGLFGVGTPEANQFLRDMNDKRPDLVTTWEVAPGGTRAGENPVTVMREKLKDPRKVADLPLVSWQNPTFQSALQDIFGALPGGARARTNIENTVLTARESGAKQAILAAIP